MKKASFTIACGVLCMLQAGCSSSPGGVVANGTAGGGGVGGVTVDGSAGWPSGGSSTGGSGTGGSGGTAGSGTGGTAGSSTGGSSGSGGSSTGGTAGSGNAGGSSGYNPICLGPQSGAYCGGDAMKDADPNVLYHCPGQNQAPDSQTNCPNGCVTESQGTADHCKTVTSPGGYKLPWRPGVTMQLTQDCNDSCCNDHVNHDKWAWDFANGGSFLIVASRGGTITHLKDNSITGCGSSSCVNDANFIVIDHGDGTQSTYLHLKGNSLQSGITCGATVQQGQALAMSGTTGWSTGIHLHFEVDQVHTGAATCECGSDGMGCGASTVPWGDFWPSNSSSYSTVAIQFDEWPASSSCNNRRITLPASTNN